MSNRKEKLSLVFVGLLLFGSLLAVTKVSVAAPLPFDAPLSEKYLRLEVVVPNNFSSKCTMGKKSAKCKVSVYSAELLRVFKVGTKRGINVDANERRKEISFNFDDERIVLQDKVLEGPPRWVIEIGYPETLIQPIEEELPFRPYKMAVQTVQLKRPSMTVRPLSGEGADIELFNRCYQLWEEKRLKAAWAECKKIDTMFEADPSVKSSVARLKAEIIYQHLGRLSNEEATSRRFIGQNLFYMGNRINHTSGTNVDIRYSITGQAQSATLSILDANGQQVFKRLVDVGEAGRIQNTTWMGVDLSESEVPTGSYSVVVSPIAAPDAKEAPTAQTYVKGLVTNFQLVNGLPKLLIDGNLVNRSAIIDPETDKPGSKNPKDYFYMEDPNADIRDGAISYLKRAQEASGSNERERARYILLASDLMYKRSPNEAIQYLQDMQGRFMDADPYLLAERARLLLLIDSHDEAKRVLDHIARLDTRQEHVMGARLLALASLAYSRQDYTNATVLYDEARESFPELLMKEPGPLFQVAELYFRARRLEEARPFYQEFLDRFSNRVPHWIAKIRLSQIKSFDRPLEAANEMVSLGQTLENEEGQQLAQLYSITLASNNVRGPSPETVLSNVSNGTPSPYVLQELWMQKARRALGEGDLQTAFDYSQKIVEKMPNSALLRDSSLFFQRVLLLQVDNLLRKNENLKLLLLFLKEKKRRFREPAVRGLLHLYVARATRELKMLELAIQDVISEGGLPGANDPKVSALLNLELTGVYRELIQDNDSTGEEARTDINQFKQLVESLQKRYPNQFDSYDYWASLGYYHELQGNLRKAKQIYLYALNGPNMNAKERLFLGESIFKVYMAMPDKEKALHALKVLLLIHDEYRDQLNMPGFRAKILWKRVELNIDRQDWPSTVKSIKEYLVESQSVLSRIQSEQLNSKDDERRKELLFYSDLDAERRREALFYHGYALLKIGLVRQAKKQWDLLYKEAPDDVYGTLAEEELRMLSWRESISPELVKDIGAVP
ncbi:MAG: hypothetical protein CMH49_08170 [Myxococcales bacterium]|nr:hypothetical protein [Myxococcales bacterium]